MQQTHSTSVAHADFVPLGGDVRGYYAFPVGEGPFPAVLVYMEAFGVNDYLQSEVRRLAEHGYAALAPDFFRGTTFGYDVDFAKELLPKLQSVTPEQFMSDIDAAIAFLDGQPHVDHAKMGAVGFCIGGYLAVRTAIERPSRIAAAAGFYGGGIAPSDEPRRPPLLDELGKVEGELLLIYGADDGSIDAGEHGRIAERLSREHKRYDISVFPGAGHGFASRDRDSYRPEQTQTAWDQTLALFERTLR